MANGLKAASPSLLGSLSNRKNRMSVAPEKKAAPKKIGRPSTFTEELAEEFCRRIARGRGISSICNDPDMPDDKTIWRWQQRHDTFSRNIARAREERQESFAAEIRETGLTALTDKSSDPARIRAAVDALDKAARLLQPKTKVELTGAHGGPIQTMDISKLNDDQLAQLAAILGHVADAGAGEGGDQAQGG
jgi:hypothetical protein